MILLGYAGVRDDGSREAVYFGDDGRCWRVVLPADADPTPAVRVCRPAEAGDRREDLDDAGNRCYAIPAPGLGLARRNRWFLLASRALTAANGPSLMMAELL